jgi:hypothetical protein
MVGLIRSRRFNARISFSTAAFCSLVSSVFVKAVCSVPSQYRASLRAASSQASRICSLTPPELSSADMVLGRSHVILCASASGATPTSVPQDVLHRVHTLTCLRPARHLAPAEASFYGRKGDGPGRRIGPRPAVGTGERLGFCGQVKRIRDDEAAGSVVRAL